VQVSTPFGGADEDFSIATWLKPTLINDGAWHGFLGYQDGTRSPSLWVNFNGCDVGFCDCSGTSGGREAPSAGTIGGTDMPAGFCVPPADLVHQCSSAGCCDCSTANSGANPFYLLLVLSLSFTRRVAGYTTNPPLPGNAGDGISGNGMHWDTRTAQAANGNEHGGQRFAGVADNYFAAGQYTHVVWTKAGEVCNFYKNGAWTNTAVCPTHVDLHDTYTIGQVDNFFQGVIDEVQFYSFGVSAADAENMYSTGGGANGGYMAKVRAAHSDFHTFSDEVPCRGTNRRYMDVVHLRW
jgi:hypothetical protein